MSVIVSALWPVDQYNKKKKKPKYFYILRIMVSFCHSPENYPIGNPSHGKITIFPIFHEEHKNYIDIIVDKKRF